MEHLLFLAHRIPYPPNKGDKIRSYHLLRHLAQRYRVHLGTFIDDPDDWKYVDNVKQLCGETCFASLNPRTARLRSLTALTRNRALTVDFYRDTGLQSWVTKVMKEQPIERVLVFSSAMAQYAPDTAQGRRIIDFVDIDSDKWAQYADKKYWPLSWLYRREARHLLRYERQIANEFDASLFVSEAEAALFKQLAPENAGKISFFSNGVDTDYFSPTSTFDDPYMPEEHALVFTGAMDYWPNVDAAQWFAGEIFPAVRARHPGASFYVVGARPTPQVQALESVPGVHVTGTVPDVRPYVAHARIAVAPLRIARGIQNKVLEAMAMAKPVVVSPQALEGINAEPGLELLRADNAEQFVSAVTNLLDRPNEAMGRLARRKVETAYRWESNLARVDALFCSTGCQPAEKNHTPYSPPIPERNGA
jgi:sugar transferase (PEP-CTERM/EpsH1 system associated)